MVCRTIHRAVAVWACLVLPSLAKCAESTEPSLKASPLAVPDASAVATETRLINEALRRQYDYAAKEHDSSSLIATLLKLASLSDSQARRYALMVEAERLAVAENLFGVAVRTLEDRARQFDESPWDARHSLIESMANSTALENIEQAICLAEFYCRLSIASDDLTTAARFQAQLETLITEYGEQEKIREKQVRRSLANYLKAEKQRSPKTKQMSSEALTQKLFMHKRRPLYETMLAEVSREQTDAQSRCGKPSSSQSSERARQSDHAAGLRLCLDRYDWDRGIQLLASGTDTLARVAQREQRMGVEDSHDNRLAIANSWWDVSSELLEQSTPNRSDVASVRSHAAELYLTVLPKTADPFVIALIEDRLRSVFAPRILLSMGRATEESESPAIAVLAYEMYLAREDLPKPARLAAEVQLACWKFRAKAGYVRHGNEWLPNATRDDQVLKADRRLAHGIHLLTQDQPELAKEEMVAASQLDPANPVPESVIAWVYCFIFQHDLLAAEHYLEASRRQPTNGLVLVNLANCELLCGRHADALLHYERALTYLPEVLVANNVGWAIKNSRFVGLDKPTLRDFSRLYRRALVDLGIPTTENERLVYVKPFVVPNETPNSNDGSRTETQPTIEAAGSGTGFFVAPGFIVTNHHVIEGATEISISDPANPEKRHSASVVATLLGHASGQDLALLRCEGLQANASIPLADADAARGEDIMALGFPKYSIVGKELKSTRGTVVSAVTANGTFFCDCTINPGNSGGPVVDQRNRLVGVAVAITRREDFAGNTYGIAIPVSLLKVFLEEHLPAAAREHVTNNQANIPTEAIKWTEVDAKVSKATVLIQTIIRRGGEPATTRPSTEDAPLPPASN